MAFQIQPSFCRARAGAAPATKSGLFASGREISLNEKIPAEAGLIKSIRVLYAFSPMQRFTSGTKPGTASRTAETKGKKLPPSDFMYLQRPHFADLNPANPPGFGAFGVASETFGTTRTAWWRTQSQSNLCPLPNSLLTGKRTGTFGKTARFARF